MDKKLEEVLLKIPEFQERFLRLLQLGVMNGEGEYADEMGKLVINLVTEAYNAGKSK